MMASDIDSVNISCDFMLTTPTSTWRGGTMAPLESDEKDPARAAPRKGKRRRARHVALGVLGVLALGLLGGFTYVNLTYRRDFSATPLPDIQASKDPAVIARGAYVATSSRQEPTPDDSDSRRHPGEVRAGFPWPEMAGHRSFP
jgi:hypothetical protein